MNEINLSEFLKEHKQRDIAERLGVTQSAISQMLRSGRSIVVREYDELIEVCEIKIIGSFKRSKG